MPVKLNVQHMLRARWINPPVAAKADTIHPLCTAEEMGLLKQVTIMQSFRTAAKLVAERPKGGGLKKVGVCTQKPYVRVPQQLPSRQNLLLTSGCYCHPLPPQFAPRVRHARVEKRRSARLAGAPATTYAELDEDGIPIVAGPSSQGLDDDNGALVDLMGAYLRRLSAKSGRAGSRFCMYNQRAEW